MITTLSGDRIDEVRSLRLALHRHHSAIDIPAGFTPRSEDDAWSAWRTATVSRLRGDAELFVHVGAPGEAPDGLALVTMLPSAELLRPVLRPEGDHAELVTLVVAASHRSAGVGTALYATAADWARDRGAVALHVDTRAANLDGLRFYARQGAVPAFATLLQPL